MVSRKTVIHIFISLGAALLYIPFLGSFHLFDWDEINFAEAAREMLVTGDWGRVQIAFEPFWEKPPLFIWLQAISMKIFGINEFAARLPNALAGIVSLNMFYHIGKKHIGHFFGLFFILAYAGSLAPTLYFKTGIIDPVFNLFIFLSIYQWFLAELEISRQNNARIHYLLFGLFSGLAFLTKGPVAILIAGVVAVIRLFAAGKNAWPGWVNLGIALLATLFSVGIWLGVETFHHGSWFLTEFFRYQVVLLQGQIEWHNQPWYYHFLVLFFLCAPASTLSFPFLFRNPETVTGNGAILFSYMRSLFWTVLIIFSIVTTKIIHYSSLCWIPLAFMAGYTLYAGYTRRLVFSRWLSAPILISMLPTAAFFTVAPYLLTLENRDILSPLLAKDIFATKLLLTGNIWGGWEGIPAFMFFCFVIIWVLQFAMGMIKHAMALFWSVILFSQYLYIVILPKAEKQIQGNMIETIKTESSSGNGIIESWDYKTFAILYYGKTLPSQFKGPWTKTAAADYPDSQAPNYTARKHWLTSNDGEGQISIITRCDFKPDSAFLQHFIKKSEPGAYQLWQKSVFK
jgi:4-amino-4-deoxy-L-arabinose transferase-like glycosyltransferase